MKRLHDLEDERGSIMLALMMLFMLAGLSALLLVSTVGESKATQHDSSFTTVFPAADSAIARGLFMLNHGLAAKLPSPPGTTPAPAYPAETLVEGTQSALWYAQPVTSSKKPTSYIITAITQGSVKRTVKAEAWQQQRFPTAAFADKSIVFRGGNASTSYDSATGSVNATGKGRLGSNGSVTLNGSASTDVVDLYNWGADPNPARCSGSVCTQNGGYNTYDTKLDISSPTSTQFISSALNACSTQVAFKTSATSTHALPSGTWCASSLTLDLDTTITGPTTIYVSGNVFIDHHLKINYAPGVTPIPANLQIYMLGTSYDMTNHSTIAAAIYAPLATCYGGAQSVVWGSLVCSSISNVGGWQFHYDEALGLIGGNDFRIRNYRE